MAGHGRHLRRRRRSRRSSARAFAHALGQLWTDGGARDDADAAISQARRLDRRASRVRDRMQRMSMPAAGTRHLRLRRRAGRQRADLDRRAARHHSRSRRHGQRGGRLSALPRPSMASVGDILRPTTSASPMTDEHLDGDARASCTRRFRARPEADARHRRRAARALAERAASPRRASSSASGCRCDVTGLLELLEPHMYSATHGRSTASRRPISSSTPRATWASRPRTAS